MDGVVCGTAVQLSWFSKQVLQEQHPVLQFVANLWLKQKQSVTAPCLRASCQSVAETKTQVSLHLVFMPVASLWLKQTQHLNF